MKHIGIICPYLPGHLNPFGVLGRALVARGHRVTIFQVPALEGRAHASSVEFCSLGGSSSEFREVMDRMGRLSGISSLRFVVKNAANLAAIICREAPAAFTRLGVDLLLVDQNEPAGGTVAQYLGLPFVSVAPSLPLNREPGIPPPFVPWSCSESPLFTGAMALRNRLGYALSDRLIMPINRTLNEFRKKWGLPPLHSPNDSFSTVAQLCQMPRQFDFPRRELPTNFHYVGPFVDSKLAGQDPPFPFERLDGRPLIYASFGTLQPGAKPYFERIAEACLGLEAQLVITTGKTDGKMPEFPGNAIVVPYAPQMQLLSRAALTITHGGLNTTMQSLYFGVPMIAIPMTHDQPAIAARIKWTGSGIVIPPRQLSVGRLRESIKSVMGDGRYRAAAAVLRQAIEQSGGVDRAADIVERCLEPNRLGAAPRQRSSTEQPSNPKEECVSVS